MALQHLRSSTANKRPTPAAMSDGQLAMNTNSGSPGLFLKDSSGALVKVGPVHVGTTAPNASPASGGQSGNTVGEQWLDTSGSTYVFKIWDGSAWRSEAGEFVNATGDVMTGALVMDNQQQVRFRETTANGTNFIALQAPASVASDKTITLPDVTGTVVTTGDTGTVTSTMLLDGTIVNADVNASAAIAGTKISPDFGSQNRTSTGTSTAASFIPTGSTAPSNGLYLPSSNNVAISSNGVGRVFIDSDGTVRVNTSITATSAGGFGVEATSSGNVTAPLSMLNRGTGNNSGVGLTFRGLSAASAETDYGYFRMVATDTTSRHGRIELWTTNSGTPTEKLRITHDGKLGLGTSSPVSGAQLTVAGASLAVTGQNLDHSANSIRIGEEGSGAAQIRCYGPNTSTNGSLTFKMSRSDGSNSQDVVIDSSGRLGIGATTVQSRLHVAKSGAEGYEFYPGDSSNANVTLHYNRSGSAWVSNTQSASAHIFSIQGTEAARVDSSSRLLVGTSSVTTAASTSTNNLLAVESANNYLGVSFTANCNDSNGSYLVLKKSRGTTAGSNTVVQSGDEIGNIFFEATDGSASRSAAAIRAFVDGTPGASDMPGRLVFSTTADGASSPTERMRISNTGTTSVLNGDAGIRSISTASAGTSVTLFRGSHSGYDFVAPGLGTECIYIWSNGNVVNTNNSYGSISDIKLKENIVDANSQWDDLKALQVRNYNFKEGQTHTQIGVIAQEVELISPGLVSETPDRDEEGNDLGTTTKSVNYSVLYMKAVKALQEAMERIETLESRVAQLEGDAA